MTLTDKRIVIVGGSSGIGFAVAVAAVAHGGRVVLVSSDQARIDAALARLPGAEGHAVDVTRENEVAALFGCLGPLDHLVFTAGDWSRAGRGPLASLDLDEARRAFEVRFWGALKVVKHAHPHMPPDGSITLTDGMYAHRPTPGGAVSTAMLGGIEHLVRGLAVELTPLRVNAVCLGLIQTNVWDSMPAQQRDAMFTATTARQPLARAGQPAEAAEAYLYLMRGGYTTGQVLRVDGGGSLV